MASNNRNLKNVRPLKEWRCFYCDDVFITREAAADHFGRYEDGVGETIACKIPYEEQSLVSYIRRLQIEISGYHQQDNELCRCIEQLQFKIADLERNKFEEAEQRGYDKGVQDMKKQGYCPEPEKHNA